MMFFMFCFMFLFVPYHQNPPTTTSVPKPGTGWPHLFQFLQPTTRRTSETFRQGIFQGIDLQGQHLAVGEGAAGWDGSPEKRTLIP